ncbi:MAG: RsbRD N-terminal domain-containing protein [Deltaproteobacteria bacterium]|nr:RsbRD N-terminal domain-containing protein [Deltaproteobacteria bacterium]
MKINHLLRENRQKIVKTWFDLILETYPAQTATFLKTQNNPFHNPVGHTIFEGIEGLFEELLQGRGPDRAAVCLDNIIRIRALQELTPSRAISFIFLLKKVIRETLAHDIRKHHLFEELMTLESSIDDLAALSFDIFMKCREKLYELKAKEARNLTIRLLQRENREEEKSREKNSTAGL